MAKTATSAKEPANFEKSLEELEGIVQKMENQQLPLNELLDNLKRGIELGKLCHSTLDAAEQQVKILMGNSGQPVQLEQFAAADDDPQDN